jgi:hypothetical protein
MFGLTGCGGTGTRGQIRDIIQSNSTWSCAGETSHKRDHHPEVFGV